jgi:hypothetical protein
MNGFQRCCGVFDGKHDTHNNVYTHFEGIAKLKSYRAIRKLTRTYNIKGVVLCCDIEDVLENIIIFIYMMCSQGLDIQQNILWIEIWVVF